MKNGFYAHYLPIPKQLDDYQNFDDPVIKEYVDKIKKIIFDSLEKQPIEILNEVTLIRPPIYFDGIVIPTPNVDIGYGTVTWKAELIFEENDGQTRE